MSVLTNIFLHHSPFKPDAGALLASLCGIVREEQLRPLAAADYGCGEKEVFAELVRVRVEIGKGGGLVRPLSGTAAMVLDYAATRSGDRAAPAAVAFARAVTLVSGVRNEAHRPHEIPIALAQLFERVRGFSPTMATAKRRDRVDTARLAAEACQLTLAYVEIEAERGGDSAELTLLALLQMLTALPVGAVDVERLARATYLIGRGRDRAQRVYGGSQFDARSCGVTCDEMMEWARDAVDAKVAGCTPSARRELKRLLGLVFVDRPLKW